MVKENKLTSIQVSKEFKDFIKKEKLERESYENCIKRLIGSEK